MCLRRWASSANVLHLRKKIELHLQYRIPALLHYTSPYSGLRLILFQIFDFGFLICDDLNSSSSLCCKNPYAPTTLFWMSYPFSFTFSGMLVLHYMEARVEPPERYPDLYPALFSLFGAGNLIVVYVVGICWQWYSMWRPQCRVDMGQ